MSLVVFDQRKLKKKGHSVPEVAVFWGLISDTLMSPGQLQESLVIAGSMNLSTASMHRVWFPSAGGSKSGHVAGNGSRSLNSSSPGTAEWPAASHFLTLCLSFSICESRRLERKEVAPWTISGTQS